jgi:hypothetical protein
LWCSTPGEGKRKAMEQSASKRSIDMILLYLKLVFDNLYCRNDKNSSLIMILKKESIDGGIEPFHGRRRKRLKRGNSGKTIIFFHIFLFFCVDRDIS